MATIPKLLTIPQPQSYHDYADRREWHGIPYAANVLSNLPLALVGAAGLLRGNSSPSRKLMHAGLVAAALGSAYYHLRPGQFSLIVSPLTGLCSSI